MNRFHYISMALLALLTSYPYAQNPGDLNADGVVDVVDSVALRQRLTEDSRAANTRANSFRKPTEARTDRPMPPCTDTSGRNASCTATCLQGMPILPAPWPVILPFSLLPEEEIQQLHQRDPNHCPSGITPQFLPFTMMAPQKGDLNMDGIVDTTDAVILDSFLVENLTLPNGGSYLPGDLVEDDPILGSLRFIPTGSFRQGSPADEACRTDGESSFLHILTCRLAVMETETTRQMWAFLKSAQPNLPEDPTNIRFGSSLQHPVQLATWQEAVLFANLISSQKRLGCCYFTDADFTKPLDATNYQTATVFCDWSAMGFRLPTEGEWEFFCRAGATTPFFLAEPAYTETICGLTSQPGMFAQLETAAWFWGNSAALQSSSPAGTRIPNSWKLKDVHGNAGEWCWDWFSPYPAFTVTDYRGPSNGSSRITRGGMWFNDPRYCRSAVRFFAPPDFRIEGQGFRLVRSLR